MILISHRGNINGKNESYENDPSYIDIALKEGYDIEVDVWYINNIIYLGHDHPQYNVEFRWFRDRITKLWIHCKNIEAMLYFTECEYDFNYFWHQKDDITLTSKKYLWTYPGKKITNKSIAVLPEQVNYSDEELNICFGICSDYIKNNKNI